MATRVKLTDGEGVLALPAGEAGGLPAIVIVQEYWGINAWMQQITAEWAAAGFVAIAPDLFGGKIATTAADAETLMGEVDRGRAVAQIGAAVAYVRTHARANGKVCVVGYCMGGAIALAAATMLPDLAGVIPFYGLPGDMDWSKVTAPIQGHYCEGDRWATIEGAKKIQAAVGAGRMELHTYAAHHAFCNATRPEVYDAAAAKLAFERATNFARRVAA